MEETAAGSDNLEEVFESNLTRVGQMVAILDSWQQPVYLSRIWTVYEQFVASKIHIPVTFTMPAAATEHLYQQVHLGKTGIEEITRSLGRVDSQQAKAWKPEDELKVKTLIQTTVGFEHVNKHVTDVMLRWFGEVMKNHLQGLIDTAKTKKAAKQGFVGPACRAQGG